jgi:hypothetical protein
LVAKLTTVNFSQLSGGENIPVRFYPLHGKNPVLPICQTNTPRVEANKPKEGNPETDLGKNHGNLEKKRKKEESKLESEDASSQATKKKKRCRTSLLPEKGEEVANNLRDYGGEDQNVR